MSNKLPPLRLIDISRCLPERLNSVPPNFLPVAEMQQAMIQVFSDATETVLVPLSRREGATELSNGWIMNTMGHEDLPWHRIVEFSNESFAERLFVAVQIQRELSKSGKKALQKLESEVGQELPTAVSLKEKMEWAFILGTEKKKILAEAGGHLTPDECSRARGIRAFVSLEFNSDIIDTLKDDGFCMKGVFKLFSRPEEEALDGPKKFKIEASEVLSIADTSLSLQLLSEGLEVCGYRPAVQARMEEMDDVEYVSYADDLSAAFRKLGAGAIYRGKGLYGDEAEGAYSYGVRWLIERQFGGAFPFVSELATMLEESGYTSSETAFRADDGFTTAYASGQSLFIKARDREYVLDLTGMPHGKIVGRFRVTCVEGGRSGDEMDISSLLKPGELDVELMRAEGNGGHFEITPQRGYSRKQILQICNVTNNVTDLHCLLSDELEARSSAPGI